MPELSDRFLKIDSFLVPGKALILYGQVILIVSF